VTAAEPWAQKPRPSFVGFWEFLEEELAPFPGRAGIVARMVIASTVMMVITMVFRLPYGAYSAFYVFQLSRESQRASIHSAQTIVAGFGMAAGVALIGAMLVLGNPDLRGLTRFYSSLGLRGKEISHCVNKFGDGNRNCVCFSYWIFRRGTIVSGCRDLIYQIP
jgi:hypothetical protein